MPNLPEDESESQTPPPILNGNHDVNGYQVFSDEDELDGENDADDMPHVNGIVRIRLVEGNESDESTEQSADEEAQEDQLDDGEKAPFFGDNPVYLRRYQFVSDLIKNQQWTRDIKRLVDIGANNCAFLYRLRNNGGMRHLREAIALDVDESLLEWHRKKTEPLHIGNLLKEHMRRFYPLDVYHMAGSIGEVDKRLENVDAVTAIELIEHLYPETLAAFPEVVFGHMRPKLAVITTPNREFNTLFPNFEGPFRHWDHKFEFTRKEFRSWSETIIENYPEYSVTFDGVGEQPLNIESTEDLGFCSQIAIFIKKDFETEAKNGLFANRERGSYIYPNINLVQTHSERTNDSKLYPYKVVVHHRAELMPDERSMELRCFHTLNSHIKELVAIEYEYLSKIEDTDIVNVNPKIYFHRIQAHLKEYCYDDYGDEYPELNEMKVGEILGEYKDDFIIGYDDEGVYFQVTEGYWYNDVSENESDWDNFSFTSDQGPGNLIEYELDGSLLQQNTSADWSDIDTLEHEEPVVPPASLEKEELWSDAE